MRRDCRATRPSAQVPQLSPSLIMYQQLSLHGFNLAQWVAENGNDAYVSMLQAISELVAAEKLNLFTKTLCVHRIRSCLIASAAPPRPLRRGRSAAAVSFCVPAHAREANGTEMRQQQRPSFVNGDETAAAAKLHELR